MWRTAGCERGVWRISLGNVHFELGEVRFRTQEILILLVLFQGVYSALKSLQKEEERKASCVPISFSVDISLSPFDILDK